MINDNEDHESKSIKDYRQSGNWPKWIYSIEEELNSLYKWLDFGPVVQTPQGVKPMRYKWVFVKKQNKNGIKFDLLLNDFHKDLRLVLMKYIHL